MIKRTFCVHDTKAEAYLDTFNRVTVGLAKREFAAECNKEGSPFNQYPHDFTLIECGFWDDSKGLHTPEAHIDHGTAATYITSEDSSYELSSVG